MRKESVWYLFELRKKTKVLSDILSCNDLRLICYPNKKQKIKIKKMI